MTRDAHDPTMDTQHPHIPQESDMPNNQRRHREQMGVLDQIKDLLTEILDRMPEREVACTRPEPGDVAEEPDEPMRTLPEAISGRIVIPHPSFSLEITSDGISPDLYAILTGSAMPAADITEEPPVGSQVTDCEGDVWEQVGAGWQVWDRTASMWGGRTGWGSSVGPRSHAPLRSTTDADRERVGLPVESAPADVDPEPKAELDEVEALAKVLRRVWTSRDNWDDISCEARDEYRRMARVAREHIEAERMDAEAKRDQWKADVRDAAIARADRAEGLHDALRHDVWVESGSRVAAAAAAAHGILARDTERAES